MEWDEIFKEYKCFPDNTVRMSVDFQNLRMHLIASWACIEDMKKRIMQLENRLATYGKF
jgi:hypothetical protein